MSNEIVYSILFFSSENFAANKRLFNLLKPFPENILMNVLFYIIMSIFWRQFSKRLVMNCLPKMLEQFIYAETVNVSVETRSLAINSCRM